MAGHSHFKNMMHRKGRADKIRSKLFTKLSREITVSAKLGSPDPEMNPRLRAAVQAARAANMPKDNIERAIKKSQGNIDNSYEFSRYEGFGPGRTGVIIEVLTDNKNRSVSNIRTIFKETFAKVVNFLDQIEDDDDVQNVFTNFEVDEKLLEGVN